MKLYNVLSILKKMTDLIELTEEKVEPDWLKIKVVKTVDIKSNIKTTFDSSDKVALRALDESHNN